MKFLEHAKRAVLPKQEARLENETLRKLLFIYLELCRRYERESKDRTGGSGWSKSDKKRLRSLAGAYAFLGNKQSSRAKRIMALINRLRAKRDRHLSELQETLRASTIKYNQHAIKHNCSNVWANCTRCGDLGMGQYMHVERGVCFSCGRYPTINLG